MTPIYFRPFKGDIDVIASCITGDGAHVVYFSIVDGSSQWIEFAFD